MKINNQLDNVDIASMDTDKTLYNIPNIVHFLPRCDTHQEKWKEMNPEFLGICWSEEVLAEIQTKTPFLCDIHTTDKDELQLLRCCILMYHYGGTIIGKAYDCRLHLNTVFSHFTKTLLMVCQASEGILLDTSFIACSPKINALPMLFEYLQKAKQQDKCMRSIFKDFVQSSMDASSESAIVCVSKLVLDKLTNANPIGETRLVPIANALQKLCTLQDTFTFGVKTLDGQSTDFCNTIQSMCRDLKGQDGSTSTKALSYNVFVIDNHKFDEDAPVPYALALANTFQSLSFASGAIFIVGNCAKDSAGIDIMLRPQLQLLCATELYRDGYSIWRFP